LRADPTDLEFSEDHLDATDALAAALDDLLARKPHGDPRGKLAREPHLWRRVASTSPHCCGNEPARREHG
jgi:hypothetical protein